MILAIRNRCLLCCGMLTLTISFKKRLVNVEHTDSTDAESHVQILLTSLSKV